jgi:hypothetical protein
VIGAVLPRRLDSVTVPVTGVAERLAVAEYEIEALRATLNRLVDAAVSGGSTNFGSAGASSAGALA